MINKEKSILPFFNSDISVIFEVGAYNCKESLEFSKLFPNAIIYAFEPVKKNYKKCKNAVDENSNIRVYKLGMAETEGIFSIYTNKDGSASSVLCPNNEYRKKKGVEASNFVEQIKVTTIEKFCIEKNISKIDILWSVTNGYDLNVLKGIGNIDIEMIITRLINRPVHFEIPDETEMRNYIDQMGFQIIEEILVGKKEVKGTYLICRRSTMEMNIGEVVDRLSILFHKVEKVGEECLPEFYAYAKDILLNSKPEDFEDLVKALRDLYRINGIIWALESDIRKGKEGQMGLEEVGRRALEIRGYNTKRVEVKNQIAEKKGHFKDIKVDHSSLPGRDF